MKTFTKLLAATAVALTMGSTAANAAIFISIDGATDLFASVPVDGMGDFSQSFASLTAAQRGGFESVTVDGSTGPAPVVLGSRSVSLNNAGGAHNNPSIKIWVTQTDLTSPLAAYFTSSFAFNANKAWSGSLQTLVSTTNQKYMGVTAGGLQAFAANTCLSNTCSQSFDVASLGKIDVSTAPYSITHVYEIKANSAVGKGDLSALSSTVVPEPGTWALMILGFGGAGAMLRSRRQAAAVA
jgi:hypothetical protein